MLTDQETIETIFRIIVFASQPSLYGAVANMCEEFETHQDRSGQPDVLMGQSIVLSEIKAEIPLEKDDQAYQTFPLQRYEERIELLSQENKVSKICMDAGFLSVVEIGQYLMTKDNGEQFYAKASRESLFQEMKDHHNQKDGPRETQKLEPYWKIRPVACMVNITWSLSEDNTQSWVRISRGSNNSWLIRTTTTQKFLQIYLKNKRQN